MFNQVSYLSRVSSVQEESTLTTVRWSKTNSLVSIRMEDQTYECTDDVTSARDCKLHAVTVRCHGAGGIVAVVIDCGFSPKEGRLGSFWDTTKTAKALNLP